MNPAYAPGRRGNETGPDTVFPLRIEVIIEVDPHQRSEERSLKKPRCSNR